jgi:hypothetical protein
MEFKVQEKTIRKMRVLKHNSHGVGKKFTMCTEYTDITELKESQKR